MMYASLVVDLESAPVRGTHASKVRLLSMEFAKRRGERSFPIEINFLFKKTSVLNAFDIHVAHNLGIESA